MCMGRLSSSGCGVGGIEGRPRVVASLSSPLRCSGGSWKFATTHKVNIERSYEGGIFGLPGFVWDIRKHGYCRWFEDG